MREKNDTSRLFLDTRLKFRHLRLLVALDDYRNIARAAESIGLSQPGASKLLADVERVLGVRLFERTSRGLEPNELSKVFIRRARAIVFELSKAGDELLALKSGHVGVVNVGVLGTRGLELVARAAKKMKLKEKYPLVQMWVDVGNTEYLMKRVADGELDFVVGWVTPDIDPSLFSVEMIGSEKFEFICAAGHPLLDKERVHLEDLVGAEWVLQSSDSLVRRASESLFAARGLPIPTPVITATSLLSMIILLQEMNAVSVATATAVRRFSSPGGFRVLPVADPIGSEKLGIVSLSQTAVEPTAQLFLDVIKEIAADTAGDQAVD